MPKDTCILCGIETQYEMDENIDYRTGYIEGAGQLCSECWTNGTNRTSLLIPISTIKNTPNDMELGKLVRKLYHESIK